MEITIQQTRLRQHLQLMACWTVTVRNFWFLYRSTILIVTLEICFGSEIGWIQSFTTFQKWILSSTDHSSSSYSSSCKSSPIGNQISILTSTTALWSRLTIKHEVPVSDVAVVVFVVVVVVVHSILEYRHLEDMWSFLMRYFSKILCNFLAWNYYLSGFHWVFL